MVRGLDRIATARAFSDREAELAEALRALGRSDPRDCPNHTRSDLWSAALAARIITEAEYEAAKSYVGPDAWWYAGD